MDNQGKFIVIEGIDGSGKTTQMQNVVEELAKKGHLTYVTSEPSKEKIGKLCRVYLKDETSNPHVDALLFAADRIEHYQSEVAPKLHQGYIVLTDRYILSSVAYQGSQGVSTEWIKQINKQVPPPDLTVFLDIPVETAVARLEQQTKIKEKFERHSPLQKVLEIYLQEDSKYTKIDGTLAPNVVTEQICQEIQALLP